MDPVLLARQLAIVSGVLLIALGLGALFLSRRSATTMMFAAFAIVWGAMVAIGNMAELSSDLALNRRLTLYYLAAFVTLYVPLVYFVALLVPGRSSIAKQPLRAAVFLAPAAIGAIALVVAPDLLLANITTNGTSATTTWGPLFAFFDVIYFFSFFWAIYKLDRARRDAPSALAVERLSLLLVAFLLYVAYNTFENVFLFLPTLLSKAPFSALTDVTFFFDALVGAALVTLVAARAWRERDRPRSSLIVTAAALAAVFGTISGVTLAFPLGFTVDTIGLFRTASVVLIAYAILRYELFDIDVKVKRGAIVTGILIVAGLLAIGIEQALESAIGSTGLAITITQFTLVGAVVAVVMKAPAVGRALSPRVLPGLDAPDRLDARRLEVYEAALAQAAAAPGGLDSGAPFLADLRARLGVSDAEHALLARLVVRGPTTLAAREPALEPGALVVGRYRLERLLGEGSAGSAWLARDETLARRVVLKTLHARLVRSDEAARAFLREARVAAALDHANVVRVFDFGSSGDTPFLVMELVDGGSLEERLASAHGAALPADETRAVARDVLAGLAHVHARGVLHRDLKPANVLLTSDGVAKISDFGVALATAAASADETHTGLEPAPVPKGTLATMSPEAVRALPLTPASDVYGVGAILYRCATGQPYLRLEGRSREAARAAILAEPPLPAPPGAPADLVRVAMRALEKEPARRYQSADEMREALEAQLVVTV